MKSKKQPKYWYVHVIGECPMCGKDQSYRQRRFTPRPNNPSDRVEYMSEALAYCGCMDREWY